jgi:hypothetical protein
MKARALLFNEASRLRDSPPYKGGVAEALRGRGGSYITQTLKLSRQNKGQWIDIAHARACATIPTFFYESKISRGFA